MSRFRRLTLLGGATAALTLVLAGCSSGTTSSTQNSKAAQTITFAEQPGTPPNYIFPLLPPSSCTTANLPEFEYMMWRPLVWLGSGQTLTISEQKSLYSKISYNSTSTAVTISLKHMIWSDGQPVTSRDISFYLNLVKANATNDCWYVPNDFPSDITSYEIVSPTTIVLNLARSYNRQWFTWNELSDISPIPQQAWDKTSSTSPIGNYDETTSGAKAVWDYLNQQSENLSTYTTNPLWKVVDGPWRLAGYETSGLATFVPNASYSLPDKAHVGKLVELPFTSDAAEFSALLDKQVDVGYVPPSDVGAIGQLTSAGFNTKYYPAWGISYYVPDFLNKQVGPILSQLYIRQALAHLVPQSAIIKTVYHGRAFPTYGPVPVAPRNPFVSAAERGNPYPYSVSASVALLKTHGWSVTAGGPDVCIRPGTGPGHCGADIPSGATLTFSYAYNSSDLAISQESQILKSTASAAGIVFNLQGEPENSVFALAGDCPGACTWQLIDYGFDGFSGIPSGETMFLPGASSNNGGYNDPKTSQLILATNDSNAPGAFAAYENYVAKQLPWIWLPDEDGATWAVSTKLSGVLPPNVFNLFPAQDWSVK